MPQENIYFSEETYEKILKQKNGNESVSEYVKKVVSDRLSKDER